MQHLSSIILAVYFSICLSIGDIRMTPRITHQPRDIKNFRLPQEEPYAVYHLSHQDSLYVGGQEILYHFDFKENATKRTEIKAENANCRKAYCKNYVTLVAQLEGKLLVCGTNSYKPTCWSLNNGTLHKRNDLTEEFSPQIPGTNYNVLITGNETYSTVIRQTNNGFAKKPRFHKIYGSRPLLYTGDYFMRNPHFVKSMVVEKEDKDQDKILLFFREDNVQTRTSEKSLSMVAHICKGEQGAQNTNSYNMFSTALKSRLVCGSIQKGQYFPVLQDVFLLKSRTGNLIYGLFTNAWNHSAVCLYSLLDIENVFSTSTLFESENNNLRVRPGTCLPSGGHTPEDTFTEVSKHPELTDWVEPKGRDVVFQTLSHYTRFVVDEITGDGETNRVIFLATDNGTVHKIVELGDGATNIQEIRLFSKSEKILYLELEPTKHALYVGTATQVVRLLVDDCTAYNQDCESCIRARDPYCGWENGSCRSVLRNKRSLQNITHGARVNCIQQRSRVLPQTPFSEGYNDTRYFLTCPAVSKHATYSWRYGDIEISGCTPHNGVCALLFDKVTDFGEYQCIEQEQETQRLVSRFLLVMENRGTPRLPTGLWAFVTLLVLFYM
ncbi:semaphorin-7A [Spea bombifrons]|uniref:semaphorin-7A n=1 Tax=Spea bombifrons TaxID=233779 RepID=UPI002349A01C|nr:semaphorin-7A [Spea bombifrons]